jgi:septal ring factor EnvC (AmiA/AmiB activator)
MNMPTHFAVALAATAALTLSACAGQSELDAGQRISARGESIVGRGAAWSDGQRDVQNGEKLLKKNANRAANAERDLRDARQDAAKAERKLQQAQNDQTAAQQQIAAGQAQMARAEAEYRDIRQRPPAIPQS